MGHREARERLTILLTMFGLTFFYLATASKMINWYDVHYFEEWFYVSMSYGVLSVYSLCEKVHYPPLAVLYYVSYRYLLHALHLDVNLWEFFLLLKIPLIASYLATLVLLLQRFEWPTVQWVALSIPAGMVIWGYQFDTIIALAMTLSAVGLLERRPVAAGTLLALASSFKYVPAIAVVPMSVLLRTRCSEGHMMRFLAAFAGVIAVLWLPFFLSDPRAFLEQVLLFHMRRLPQDLTPFYVPILLSRWRVSEWSFLLGKLSGIAMTVGLAALFWWMWRRQGELVRSLVERTGPRFTLWGTCALLNAWFALTTKVGNPYYLTWIFVWMFPFVGWCIPSWRFGLLNLLPFVYTFNMLPAPVLDREVFVPEDVRWYPALQLILFPQRELEKVSWMRETFPHLFRVWYDHMHITGAIVVIAYVAVAAWTFVDLVRWARNPRKPRERPHDWPLHPLLIALALPAFAFAVYLAFF
ncbi:MAG: glycosyltransferase 87 family protein [Euryarchaeota archaeon]